MKNSNNPQIEQELDYHDWDHSEAHGASTTRTRTLSRSTQDLQAKGLRHYRRASHDDKSKQRRFIIDVEETKKAILEQEDTDGDCQITIHDVGPKAFTLGTHDSLGFRKYEIRGTYRLSNLLQELALASEHGRKQIVIDEDRLNENPVTRLSRLIKYHFWDELTRRIDHNGLKKICADPKAKDAVQRIYIPFHDQFAFDYFSKFDIQVIRLPEIITPEYVKSLNDVPGILSLGLRQETVFDETIIRGTPFVVPGGRFNEMYGWDSYFEALGLLVDERVELARGMVENFWYEIDHYGKILNANRTYYLTRSQPPFLTDMMIKTFESLKRKWAGPELHIWIDRGIRAAVKELFSVWMAPPRYDPIGLMKYHPQGIGMPPETESTHFDHIIEPYANKLGISIQEYSKKYNSGEIKEPELDQYFLHDRAVRESGHDTTYRFESKCAHLATIDLNSLVYKYQTDLSHLIEEHCNGCLTLLVRRGPNDHYLTAFISWLDHLSDMSLWDSSWAAGITFTLMESTKIHLEPAYDPPNPESEFFHVYLPSSLFFNISEHLRASINKHLWNENEGLYYDWDCHLNEQCVYESATTLWALWANVASQEQAHKLVPEALKRFEMTGGLVAGTEASRGRVGLDRPNRQWDYPIGWAPHQMLAWTGLLKYGFEKEAQRICYRWLYTLTTSFVDFNGVVPEKYDVVNMTHKFHYEYGNVGSDFKCVVKEGFGWMNASYQVGLKLLSKAQVRALGNLTRPDVFFAHRQ